MLEREPLCLPWWVYPGLYASLPTMVGYLLPWYTTTLSPWVYTALHARHRCTRPDTR